MEYHSGQRPKPGQRLSYIMTTVMTRLQFQKAMLPNIFVHNSQYRLCSDFYLRRQLFKACQQVLNVRPVLCQRLSILVDQFVASGHGCLW